MKKVLPLILFSLFLTYSVKATIRTVNNVPGSVAQFNNLDAAISVSATNDTILLAPSATSYGISYSNTLKQLYFIGAGFAPTYNANGTSITTNYIRGASTFEGIHFRNASWISLQSAGATFVRCFFSDSLDLGVNISNMIISSCFFTRPFNGNNVILSNSIIRNNIFRSSTENCLVNFNNGSSLNVIFDHNLFYGTNGGLNAFNNVNNIIFTNNIFLKMNFTNSVTNSNFTKNLTFNTAGGIPPVWTANGNSSSNNLFDTSPLFPDMTSINNGTISWAVDYYKVGAASLGINAGTDGKDVGLFFNNVGFDNYNYARNSRLPYIASMLIDSPNLPLGSTLGVTVQAVKAN